MTEKIYDLTSFTRRWAALHPMPPLQHAIYNVKKTGYRPILALLKTGAELDAVDAQGATALHEAVARREPEMYALLAQAGANPDLADAGGVTPASLFEDVYGMTYEEKFRDRIIDADDFRIRKHAYHDEQSYEDNAFTPSGSASHPVPALQHAVHHSDSAGIEPVLALLEAGADLDAVDARGCTALHQAVFDERPDIYALLVQAGADPNIDNRPGSTAARFYESYYGPFEHSYWGSGSMPTTSASNMQAVKPTGGCVFFKAFGRLMHRIGHPPHHALRFRTNLWMGWRDYRSGTALFRGEFTQDTVAELVKFLLAHTGLPRIYRKLDRWRRRNRPHVLDTLTQEAARLFFSHLDVASLPPMSRAILYGSRARGDYRDDSDVDIMLVFAGPEPDYDTEVQVCNAMAAAQSQANAALQDRTEVTSFCNWQDEFDEPDRRRNPDFFRNVLADGIDIMQPVSGQPT